MERSSVSSKKSETRASVIRKLQESLDQGTVVGIYLKGEHNKMLLTAVEKIDDSIVVVRELDLQGIFHDDNRIAIDMIDRVHCFRAKYDDRVTSAIRNSTSYLDGEPVKIRQKEVTIRPGELKIIIIRSIDSGYRVNIFLHKGTRIANCFIRDFSPADGKVRFSQDLDEKMKVRTVSLDSVAKIEFETFFYHGGLLSKVFTTQRADAGK